MKNKEQQTKKSKKNRKHRETGKQSSLLPLSLFPFYDTIRKHVVGQIPHRLFTIEYRVAAIGHGGGAGLSSVLLRLLLQVLLRLLLHILLRLLLQFLNGCG